MTLTINEQIAPEIAQALIAQATARGLTVNGYLRQVLGLPGAGTARCWDCQVLGLKDKPQALALAESDRSPTK